MASLPSPLSLPPPPPSIVVGRDEEEDRSEGSLGELGDLKGLEAWTQGGDFSPSSAVQSFSMGKITEMDFRKTIVSERKGGGVDSFFSFFLFFFLYFFFF